MKIKAASQFLAALLLVAYMVSGCSMDGEKGLLMTQAIDLLQSEKYDEAVKLFDKVISADPGEWKAYANRGIAYDELNRPEDAIADFTKAIQLCPSHDTYAHENYYNRAMAYSRTGKPDKAVEDFTKAIELSSDASQYALRGRQYHMMGSDRKAIEDFDVALKQYGRSPWSADVLYFRAVSLIAQKKDKQALQDLNDAIERHEKNAGTYKAHSYHERAIVHERLGEPALAKSDALKAQELGYKASEDQYGSPIPARPKDEGVQNSR